MKLESIPLRDGQQLGVRRLGQGQPVVLLHGFGSQSSHWLPNVLPLKSRFEFFLPDLRGFGHSHLTPFGERNVFRTYADDLDDLLDHYQLERVILGGISTGAYSCLVFNQQGGFRRVSRYLNIEHSAQCRNGPDWSHGLFDTRQDEIFARFRALQELAATIDPALPYWQLPPALRLQFRHTVQTLFQRATNRRFTRLLVGLAAQYGERMLTTHFMRVDNWRVYLHIMQAFMDGLDTRDQLGTIRVPTTLMLGAQSRYFSTAGQLDLKRHIPHATVVRFEHSGHIPMLDEPVKFQREFTRFLTAP